MTIELIAKSLFLYSPGEKRWVRAFNAFRKLGRTDQNRVVQLEAELIQADKKLSPSLIPE